MRWQQLTSQVASNAAPTELLFRSYSAWLARRLRRVVPSNQVEETVQETFARLTQYGAVEGIRNPKAFLLRVATNIAARRHQREIRLPAEHLAVGMLDRQFGQDAEQVARLAFKEVVKHLPDTYRETFVLSRVVGLTNEEIARRLGVSIKTVEWRMSKALAICAALLLDPG